MKDLIEQAYIDSINSRKIRLDGILPENQTDKIGLAMVRQDGHALRFVENQTEEICLAAVRMDGTALRYVKKQTEKICIAAVKQNGSALEYVEKITDKICLNAVRKHVWALEYIEDQNEKICLAAVKEIGTALKYVKRQTKEIYKEALKKNVFSFIYIDADIYEYNEKEILDAYKYTSTKARPFLRDILNKICEVLSRLDDENLVKAVNNDLKEIFMGGNFEISDSLTSIKSKADMIAGSYGLSHKLVANKKPKII